MSYRDAVLTARVSEGVHLLTAAHVNCYLVEVEHGLLLVDTGLPNMWPLLMQSLSELGRRPQDLTGIVLTHAHFDHLGCAARLQSELGLRIWAHHGDHYLAAHPYRYKHERPRLPYPLRYPRGARVLAQMARAGALRVRGVEGLIDLDRAGAEPIPGAPQVIFSPGHTAGHCALHWADRDVILTGDALVTLDPYTGITGPQIVARAATADSAQAVTSLDALAATGAAVALTGHGVPWRDGIVSAVEQAKARPPR
jgi:glyoxylase-like metal-dependent hydrolase (beta-lactamase superfamily II)